VPEAVAAPKHVHLVDELPVTLVGKPYKPTLRADAGPGS
jgi:fatty-acyl-CoA synthase